MGGHPEWSRRGFLRNAVSGTVALVAIACSPSHHKKSVPSSTTTTTLDGFGGPDSTRLDIGTIDALRASIADSHQPRYVAAARAYVSAFPQDRLERARGLYPEALLPLLSAGLLVLHQRCPHLGCRVPFCKSSQWFECPCHAAKFDRVGEYREGPSPRGMSLLGASVVGGRLVVDTQQIYPGRPPGTNTTEQRPEGPACVG